MLQKYKYSLRLTFAVLLLHKQLQPPTLIFINKVPSVSHCSTAMLYAVFNCLCIMCSIEITEWILCCGLLSYKFSILLEGSRKSHGTPFVYSPERCLWPIAFSIYKCVNSSLFSNSALLYKIICHESEWIPACWQWSISPPCIIKGFSCYRIILQQLAFLRLWWGKVK
jgi:hypothetical protein